MSEPSEEVLVARVFIVFGVALAISAISGCYITETRYQQIRHDAFAAGLCEEPNVGNSTTHFEKCK